MNTWIEEVVPLVSVLLVVDLQLFSKIEQKNQK